MRDQDQKGAGLLPCPFCGALATNATLAGSARFDHAPNCHFTLARRTEAEAIAAWNTRSQPAPTNTGLGDLDLDGLEDAVERVTKLTEAVESTFLFDGMMSLYGGFSSEPSARLSADLRRILAARSPQPAAPEGRMREALEAAEELLAFHEGSASRETDDAEPTVRINGEDHAELLAKVRAALSTDSRGGGGGNYPGFPDSSSTTGASAHVASQGSATATEAPRDLDWLLVYVDRTGADLIVGCSPKFNRVIDSIYGEDNGLETPKDLTQGLYRVQPAYLWEDEDDIQITGEWSRVLSAEAALSSEALSPKSEPQASASAPATDEPK